MADYRNPQECLTDLGNLAGALADWNLKARTIEVYMDAIWETAEITGGELGSRQAVASAAASASAADLGKYIDRVHQENTKLIKLIINVVAAGGDTIG